MTDKYKITGTAEDIAVIEVELTEEQAEGVEKVLEKLNDYGGGYTPSFKMKKIVVERTEETVLEP